MKFEEGRKVSLSFDEGKRRKQTRTHDHEMNRMLVELVDSVQGLSVASSIVDSNDVRSLFRAVVPKERGSQRSRRKVKEKREGGQAHIASRD